MELKYTGFHRLLEIDHYSHQRDSWQIHLFNEIEVDRIEALREAFKKKGLKAPSYTAFVMKGIAQAIAEFRPKYPQINSFLKNWFGFKSIVVFDGISAGCSVALDHEDAVSVGVVQEPQSKSLMTITEELVQISNPNHQSVKNLVFFFRLPRLLQRFLHEVSKRSTKMRYENRGTFCINPVGKFGVDAHLSLPQTSCLQFGMGVIRDRVVARKGVPLVVKTFYLTVSFDRRLMNGRPCAMLMERIQKILNQAEFDDWKKMELSDR